MIRGMFPSIDISAAGLAVQRTRMNTTASNIANVNTTRSNGQAGKPYRRQRVIVGSTAAAGTFRLSLRQANAELATTHARHLRRPQYARFAGSRIQSVTVDSIVNDPTPPRLIYNPVHPDADKDGYVAMPDINIVTEMVDMIASTRAYEANITAITAAKNMARQAIGI